MVGSSGAGKSTIIDLLLRFYDPSAGQVNIDGVDIKTLRFADIREAIAVVEQTPFMFHSSIRENLQFGAPDCSEAQYQEAARSAGIHDFVLSLSDGYETIIGERGQTLSAGQRQRIAIARALLRHPSILVLDEPTAALDPISEFQLGTTLRGLTESCTVVVSTHRPGLLEIADQVIVLDHGRIIEDGSPRDLLTADSALSRHFRDAVPATAASA
jgi:ATP-binding cassette subfamily B protein